MLLRHTHRRAPTSVSTRRPAVRLGSSGPEPWRRAVRRFGATITASPMRGRTGLAGVRRGREVRSEWVVRIDGKVRRAPPAPTTTELPTGLIEILHQGDRGARPRPPSCRCRWFASRNILRTFRLNTRFLDLRATSAPEHHDRGAVVDSMRKRNERSSGIFGIQTPS